MTSSSSNYDPTFVECTGFGQNDSNAAPSLFVESIAIDLDCSVYQSLFVSQNTTIDQNLEVGGTAKIKGPLEVGGPGSFNGVVSAAGFRFGRNSFGGAAGFVVEDPATFLNTLQAVGQSTLNGLAAQVLSVAPIPPTFQQTAFGQSDSVNQSPFYQPVDSDGNPLGTPIQFSPCVLSELPSDAVVLAYIPSFNPIPN